MDTELKQMTQRGFLVDLLKSRLRLLVVCISHSWGGLEQVAANDSIEMATLDLTTSILCLEGSPIHEYLKAFPEVKLIPISFRPRNYFDFKFRSKLDELIKQEGINLVHTHQTSLLGSIAPWLWNRPGVALLATRHMLNNHNKKDFFHRAIYARVDSLLVMSQALHQNVLKTHPIRERRVKLVNLGLDFNRFDPNKVDAEKQRQIWGAEPDTVVIGLVGRIDPAKGQGTFIKAAASLLKDTNENRKLKFVIVGEETLGNENKHLKELHEMVTQFHLQQVVVFSGFQGNIPEVMRAFDIFVMPSRQETFGLVAIEAMAMECPIVISKGGSAEEIVGNEEFGLTVRPDDAFDLQRQLNYLLENPSKRVEMGRMARIHVMKNYNRATRIQKTLELYERVLRNRGN